MEPISKFEHYTEPYAHQRRVLAETWARKTYAYFWEQGLGKSKIILDVARANWEAPGRPIDALLITAPSGVHANWLAGPEMGMAGTHLPPSLDWEGMIWWPSVATGYWDEVRRGMRTFVEQRDKFLILSVSYHAFLQDKSWAILRQFLRERRVLWALDESDDIGNPGAKWTRRILRTAPLATMRRIATGTPYKDGTPLAYWSQFNFLHPQILGGMEWKAFKHYYAVWRRTRFPGARFDTWVPVKDPKTGTQRFRHLEELEALIARRTSRVTKAEALPELPPKVYEKLYVPLSPLQRQLYERLRDESELEMGPEDVRIIEMVMVRRLRLQQIVCGFYPRLDDEEPERALPGPNPRVEAAVQAICRCPGQVIVWARFRMDHDLLVARLADHVRVGRYDGAVSLRDRERDKVAFLAGELKVLCANQAAMSRGHTFVNSARAIYYSNYPRLLLREQSEDRQHRIGTRTAVLYTDIVAPDTVDEQDVVALRGKKNVADYLMSRPRTEWI